MATAPIERVSTYEEVAHVVQEARQALEQWQIKAHRDCSLSYLFRCAETLHREWERGNAQHEDATILFNAAHAQRVAQAIVQLQAEPQLREAIRRIVGNNMDLSGRQQSQGKDALWELDLLCWLRRRGATAELVDPPDIVLRLNDNRYPIACKKVYSEKGVKAQIRKGVAQLKPFDGVGIIALNLDDLTPPDSLLSSEHGTAALDYLERLNQDFIERNRTILQEPIRQGRCDGMLLSTTVLSDIAEGTRSRLNTITHVTIWDIREGQASARARIREFVKLMGTTPL